VDGFFSFYANFGALDKAFFLCAVFGGLLFVLRLVMSFFGAGDDDMTPDTDIDVDTDTGAESTHSFKILTIQGITGFFMMFGLVGLAVHQKTAEGWEWLAITAAVAAGLATIWILDKTFQAMKALQSSGTLRTDLAVGHEGTVYLTISAGGTGKVQVTVQGRLREFNAVSENRTELKTGERIRVVRVLDGSVCSEEPVHVPTGENRVTMEEEQ